MGYYSLPELSACQIVVAGILIGLTLLLVYCPTYFLRMWDRIVGRVPPGPLALPILGTIDVDRLHPDLTFRKWATRYGGLFSFFLGARFCIGVGDLKLIRRLFKDERFAGRGNSGIFAHLTTDLTKGLAFGNGQLWKEHRNFTMASLRDFGVGRSDSSQPIQKQNSILLSRVRTENGRPFDPKHILLMATANSLAATLFSHEFPSDDPGFNGFLHLIEKNMQEFANAVIMEVYPWLRKIPPFTSKFQRLNARVAESFVYLMGLVEEHRKTFNYEHPRDYFDQFFCAQENNRRVTSGVGTFTDLQLVRNMADIYITGYETTSTFLRWALIYMILHPEAQDKVQEEIDMVVGRSRQPAYSDDEQNMPFTRAVITEVHRITCFVPFGVPHCASEDVDFEGYHIPKGTEIWPLMCHHFMNPDVWLDPEVFRPGRFLDTEGALIAPLVDEVQPYSVGRRVCIGEPLARAELFTFFTSILQNFTITSDHVPSIVPVVTQVLAPPPFNIVAQPR